MNARHAASGPDEPDEPQRASSQPEPPDPDPASGDLPPLPPPPEHVLIRAGVDRHFRTLRLLMTAVNLIACAALSVNQPGQSPAFLLMRQYAPLPVWAGGFGVVVALLSLALLGFRTQITGHLLGSILWLVPAIGAVYGLLAGTTSSPTASTVLAALIVGMAGHHALALVFLRRVARLDS